MTNGDLKEPEETTDETYEVVNEGSLKDLILPCEKCGAKVSFQDAVFQEPRTNLGPSIECVGFRCSGCGAEVVSYYTDSKLRRKQKALKRRRLDLAKYKHRIPGKFKEFKREQTKYSAAHKKLQLRIAAKLRRLNSQK